MTLRVYTMKITYRSRGQVFEGVAWGCGVNAPLSAVPQQSALSTHPRAARPTPRPPAYQRHSHTRSTIANTTLSHPPDGCSCTTSVVSRTPAPLLPTQTHDTVSKRVHTHFTHARPRSSRQWHRPRRPPQSPPPSSPLRARSTAAALARGLRSARGLPPRWG